MTGVTSIHAQTDSTRKFQPWNMHALCKAQLPEISRHESALGKNGVPRGNLCRWSDENNSSSETVRAGGGDETDSRENMADGKHWHRPLQRARRGREESEDGAVRVELSCFMCARLPAIFSASRSQLTKGGAVNKVRGSHALSKNP